MIVELEKDPETRFLMDLTGRLVTQFNGLTTKMGHGL